MRCAYLPLLLLAPVLLALAPPAAARPPEKEALVDRVRQSIDGGVAFLSKAENGHGQWGGPNPNMEGRTALVLLALLTAGVDPQDPMIQRGLAFLRTVKPRQTYAVGLQIMVYALVGEAQDRPRIQVNADWLAQTHQADGWSYGSAKGDPMGEPDNSNTQYALLGLHEARLAGARVDPRLLEEVRAFYVRTQLGGGWLYRKGSGGVSMTMTTAGLCGLLISGAELQQGKQALQKDGSDLRCGVYVDDKPVADALAWIGNEFPPRLTREAAANWVSPYYALYGLERAGRLSGQRFFGGHDWYRLGCEYLVANQSREGSWTFGGPQGHQLDYDAVVATSFAVLFLAKGRTPVLITKLAHNAGEGWNNKRSDVRHLVDFAGSKLFRRQPLAWQVFDVRNRDARDASATDLAAELLPCPLLWFNGHDFAPRDREEEIVREYLANGGFVFAEACCGRQNFDTDFKKLVKRLYPANPLVPVPLDHPVWTASGRFTSSPQRFPLLGIRQGCKWVLLYSPKPISGYWEANDTTSEDGQKAFELGANIIAYATGLERPLPRLTEVAVARPVVGETKVRSGYLELAELAHDGDWSWPSKALVNVSTALRHDNIDVVLRPALVQLSPSVDVADKPDALLANTNALVREVPDAHFFYLHGRKAFTVDPKTLERMRFALDNGGLLLADAGCGASAFDGPFRDFVKQLWPDRKLEKVPLNDRLYSKGLNGTAIDKVKCRRRAADGKPESEMKDVEPELEGVKHNGRWVILYSRYDLGCALQKHGSTDCVGHDYESALRLARAAVLYALDR